ncbi:MAG: AAA family ATPase [Candidatus Thorarchaeota archaeon]|nr:AAA family ATPase [Candidatus Thorarchaeota archaeon]
MKTLDVPIFVTGPSGSGKTRLVQRMTQDFAIEVFDARELIPDFALKFGNNDLEEKLRDLYDEVIDQLASSSASILEASNDYPDQIFEKLARTFFKDKKGLVVFVSAPEQICIERQRRRENPTPEHRIIKQCSYPFSYYKDKAEILGLQILEISWLDDTETQYQAILSHLEQQNKENFARETPDDIDNQF